MNIKDKKIIAKVCTCILVWAGLTACNDFLDITPPSQVAPENYLWDESQLATYIITYYLPSDKDNEKNYGSEKEKYGGRLPSHSGSGGESFYKDDLSTDIAISSGSENRFAKGVWTVGGTGGYWNFTNIYALNHYLQTVVPRYEANQITGEPAMVRHYIGEGYFLRAQEYFFRLRMLGDFPIITEIYPDDQQTLVEISQRKPRNEVARFILQDLDKAIELLNNNPTNGKLRITKNAALLLKARVALFEGSWLKYHAGTSQVPNGPDWPGKGKEYNASYQYPAGSIDNEINFFLDQAMSASETVAESIELTPNTLATGANALDQAELNNDNPYYKMFATADPSSYSEVIMYRRYEIGLSSHTYNHNLHHGGNRGFTRQLEQSILMDNGLPVYASGSGYAGDLTVESTKDNRDWRWKLFMKAPYEAKAIENTTNIEYFNADPPVTSTNDKTSSPTGYLIGKGYSYDYDNQNLGRDVTAAVIFRASEAYLIYMEASYMKEGVINSTAAKYWRAIRNRAGVDTDFNKTIAATDMSIEAKFNWGAYSQGQIVDATLYNIRRERTCELMVEGFRYDDLRRWRAMDQLNGFQMEGMNLWGGPMKDRYDPSTLIYNEEETRNTISSPQLSDYVRPYQKTTGNQYYEGLFFNNAHYLEPIAVQHFLITSSDGQNIASSPIYQNPGWPTTAGVSAGN